MRQVAEHALPLFGIEPASLSLLAHAYNTMFAVSGPKSRCVLHILRPVADAMSDADAGTSRVGVVVARPGEGGP